MRKKTNKPFYYLKMYREWMEAGRITPNTCSGLCDYFGTGDPILELMQPTEEDKDKLRSSYAGASTYWGAETREEYLNDLFGPFRQTVLLFMAAMNNEL